MILFMIFTRMLKNRAISKFIDILRKYYYIIK